MEIIIKKIRDKFLALILIEFILSLIVLPFIMSLIMNFNILKFIICFVLGIALIIMIFLLFKENYKCYQKIFLIIGIPLVLMYTIFMIPYHIPDESTHIYRTYNISKGHLLKLHPITLPKVFINYNANNIKNYKDLEKVLKTKTNYDDVETYNSLLISSYSFICYLAPAIGLFIGRLLNLNIFISLYLGQLCNAILFLIMGYYILKKMPFGKLITFIYLLNPMMLHMSASFSADVFTNMICLLFISYCLFLKYKETNIDKKDIICLIIIMTLIGVIKYIYFPLFLLLFILLPKFKNTTKENIILFFIGLFFIIGMVYIINFSFSKNMITIEEDINDYTINPLGQIKYLLSNPFIFFKSFFLTLKKTLFTTILDFTGLRLGSLNIFTNKILCLLYYIILGSSFLFETAKQKLNNKMIILFCLIPFIIINIIYLGFYVTWSPVGSIEIFGVQARYFIPFLLLWPLTLTNIKYRLKYKNANYLYSLSVIIINICMIIIVINNFC